MWGPRRRSDGADHRGDLGRRGEDEAARYLRGLGYRIVWDYIADNLVK